MAKNPTHIRGFIIALVAGAGFILMAISFLDTESSTLLTQLVAVFVLVFGLIGLAALIAWLGRKLVQKLSRK